MQKKILLTSLITFNTTIANALPPNSDKMIEESILKHNIGLKMLREVGKITAESFEALGKTVEETSQKALGNEKVWIEGKPLRECMGDKNEINNETVKCHEGHFEYVKKEK